jgi:hypothetical protein
MNFKTIKSKPIAALAVVFFLLATMLLAGTFVSATPTGTIHAYKYGSTDTTWSYPDGSYTLGTTTFRVRLQIDGASNVWGWGVDHMTWNPAVVNCTSVSEGSFIKGSDPDNPDHTTWFLVGTIDNVNGNAGNGIADVISNSGSDQSAHGSSGVLCTITFVIVGLGDANINFGGVNIAESGSPGVYQTITQPAVTVGTFVAPEYTMGALAALVAAFAAFVAFAAFKHGIKLPTFSKHI